MSCPSPLIASPEIRASMTIVASLDAAVARYAAAKHVLQDWTGAGQELLHLHAGLAIFVLSALLLRKRMRSPVPLACVAIFGFINELVDWRSGKPIDTGEPLVDFANTVFWPFVLYLLARRWK